MKTFAKFFKVIAIGAVITIGGALTATGCSSVPHPQPDEVIEGTITSEKNGYSLAVNLNYSQAAANFFGVFYTDQQYEKDQEGKFYLVQVAGEPVRSQQKIFLADAYVGKYNLKTGDRVKYRVGFVYPEIYTNAGTIIYKNMVAAPVFIDR
jgi:hypothetical protein